MRTDPFEPASDKTPGAEEEPPPPQEVPPSPRKIAWIRRRRSLTRIARVYRKSGMGMWGLAILIAFIAIAVFAPLIADKATMDPTCPCAGKPLQPPSAEFWFGTDNLGRSVYTMTVWGARVSLLVGL